MLPDKFGRHLERQYPTLAGRCLGFFTVAVILKGNKTKQKRNKSQVKKKRHLREKGLISANGSQSSGWQSWRWELEAAVQGLPTVRRS